MCGFHTKFAFSLLTTSNLRSDVVSAHPKHQCISKPTGAEAIIHTIQQVIIPRLHDLFSADAVNAFCCLNRCLAMTELKSACPEVFNMLMSKCNNSCNAFFQGLVDGVVEMKKSE